MDIINHDNEDAPIGIDPNDRNETFGEPPANPIAESLQRIADFSERQREKVAPTIIDLTNSKVQFVTWIKLRFIEFIFSCATADHVSVSFGGRVFDFFLAAGTTTVPFAYESDRGVDIVFANITSADHATYCYIIAYPQD
jgi:hypothetical protein